MTWESSITPEDPFETYKVGEESKSGDASDFDPINRDNGLADWPVWDRYKKRDLSDFPGVTGRIGERESLADEEVRSEAVKAED